MIVAVRIILIKGVIPIPPANITMSLSRLGSMVKPPNGPRTLTFIPGAVFFMVVVYRPFTRILNCKVLGSVGELTTEKHRTGVGLLWCIKLMAAYWPGKKRNGRLSLGSFFNVTSKVVGDIRVFSEIVYVCISEFSISFEVVFFLIHFGHMHPDKYLVIAK